jgi:hypothetical protein
MSEHTPGPWEAKVLSDAPERDMAFIFAKGARIVGSVRLDEGNRLVPERMRIHSDEALANATLIAAAPDLYGAAKGLIEILLKDDKMAAGAAMDRIFDAVAKAEGA